MNIGALLQRALPQPTALRVTQMKFRSSDAIQPTSAQNATIVNISDAARTLASNAVKPESPSAETSELRKFLSKFDFHNITPRQMAEVGGELFKLEEVSEDVASAFIGVEMNLVNEMDPDQPIDMEKHFEHMLNVATGANAAEPGYFDFAVKFRQEASKALQDTISFISDDRSHIAT
jgi:hypothetical protein